MQRKVGVVGGLEHRLRKLLLEFAVSIILLSLSAVFLMNPTKRSLTPLFIRRKVFDMFCMV